MQPGAPTFSGKDTVRAEPNGEIKAKHNLQVVSPFPNWHGREKGRLVPFNGNNLKLNTAGAYLVDAFYSYLIMPSPTGSHSNRRKKGMTPIRYKVS
ncbi:unnamed protein product [Penicillium camemberti]|uniref:Str. FM013 n=1 Tax=Penicillium camemberti (strain FM 013) TaxID=1429867 RepID=A0A0G4PEI9_PENC3|nr:unnamed protein product [Penicillium camemberti]